MEKQKAAARASGKFKMAAVLEYNGEKTRFVGYERLEETGTVVALYRDGIPVDRIEEGQSGVVVLDTTPFYAESGGQVGDVGVLAGQRMRFEVEDTQKIQADVAGHHGKVVNGTVSLGDKVDARVNMELRAQTMRNHSVTHLMHKALRQVLGAHVAQRGSLVDPNKTRFDFSHNAPVTDDEIRQVEEIVNREIVANTPTQAQQMSFDEAIAHGATALFGEKYGDVVRVLDIGFSCELCGGTHVSRTGDIGFFKIVSEGGVAAGIRRIEAVTGLAAMHWVQEMSRKVDEAAVALKTQPDELVNRIVQLQDQMKGLDRELSTLKARFASSQGDDLAGKAIDVSGIKVLASMVEGADVPGLRNAMDKLKGKLKTAAIVLATVKDGKVSLIAGITSDMTSKIKAGELVNFVASQVGGKGGGRPDMAQAGGSDPSGLPEALKSVKKWVQERLG